MRPRPRPLSSEFRWLAAGLLLTWARRLAPETVRPDHPDYEPTWDYLTALADAAKAMERLPE